MIEQLDIVGPFRGPSGYDRHTREFVRAIAALGVNVRLTNLDGWSTDLPPAMRDPWFETLDVATGADTVLHFVVPTQMQPRPGMRNVNYTMFEADRLPPGWAERADGCEAIVVPTRAARDAWRNSGVPGDRISVSPLAVDGAYFSRPAEPLELALADGRPVASFGTRVLHVGELRPRKNQLGLLRAWLQATTPADDAVLIMKCPDSPALVQRLADDVRDMQHTTGRSLAGGAPVLLLPALLEEAQMLRLYASATHYMSMSCGEGWDQVMMEAAVAGLHLIAPAHTAYLEYLEAGDAEFVPATLAPFRLHGRVGYEDAALFDGLSWWPPDEDAAAQIIRGTIDGDRGRHPPPSARLAATYTWEAAARQLLDVLVTRR